MSPMPAPLRDNRGVACVIDSYEFVRITGSDHAKLILADNQAIFRAGIAKVLR